MFDNIGWGEIFFIILLAVVIIGPEKLPEVIKDIRAAVFAARRAIANARAELDGLGEEFEEFREPISQAAEWGRLGPRRALTKALFDGDESVLEDFDLKHIMATTGIDPTKETPAQAARRLRRQADALDKAVEESNSDAGSAAAGSGDAGAGVAAGGRSSGAGSAAAGGSGAGISAASTSIDPATVLPPDAPIPKAAPSQPRRPRPQKKAADFEQDKGNYGTGGGVSWEDII